MKKFSAWLLLLLMLSCCLTAQAATPYRTFSLGKNGRTVETQTAYEPVRTMTRFGEFTLDTPSDMCLGPDGNLYILDTGNKRVVVVTRTGEFVKFIAANEKGKSGKLREATGIFVDDQLNVYIADPKAKKVQVYSPDNELIAEYERPTHALYTKKEFEPSKIVLDKRGNLYIADKGGSSGIVQLSPHEEGRESEFLGFYGANSSNISFITRIKRLLFSENSMVMSGIVAISVDNLCIDEKGMVYTVTGAGDVSSLRRLNVAGRDTLVVDYFTAGNTAVAVNGSGSIFTATASGTITEYTAEGAMLFTFGAKDNGEQRIGMFNTVTALVVDDDYNIFVLDSSLNSVQVLRPTEFADEVHRAFTLFQDGKYAASQEPWENVLRMNSMFNYASTGLGESLYREGDFEEAMLRFRNGGELQGYSDAYWEYRSTWLHNNMTTIISVAAVVIAVWVAVKLCDRRWRILSPLRRAGGWFRDIPIVNQTLYCFEELKNPYDACYGIKREKRAGFLSAFIVLFIFFALYVANKYFAGFLFKTAPDGYYELMNDFLMVFGVFSLLVICCYLVCTITEGEAKFRDIFVGCAYSLAPMLIFMPIKLVLTNVLTYNEAFFITLIDVVSIGWTGLLIFLTIMYQNDYTLKKTIKIIILTIFTVLVVVALAVVLYMLISQMLDFILSIYGEVVYRFVKKV